MAGNTRSAEHVHGRELEISEGELEISEGKEEPALQVAPTQTAVERHLYLVTSKHRQPGTNAMQKSQTAPHYGRSNGMLDRSVQGQIGRMLRDVFSDVAEEAVPERFVKLLEALEAKENQR